MKNFIKAKQLPQARCEATNLKKDKSVIQTVLLKTFIIFSQLGLFIKNNFQKAKFLFFHLKPNLVYFSEIDLTSCFSLKYVYVRTNPKSAIF